MQAGADAKGPRTGRRLFPDGGCAPNSARIADEGIEPGLKLSTDLQALRQGMNRADEDLGKGRLSDTLSFG